jgi:hypothetical protein
MSVAKEEAIRLLERIPDSATWDDIMYQLYVKAKVEDALVEADAGEGVDQEEVERRSPLQWIHGSRDITKVHLPEDS